VLDPVRCLLEQVEQVSRGHDGGLPGRVIGVQSPQRHQAGTNRQADAAVAEHSVERCRVAAGQRGPDGDAGLPKGRARGACGARLLNLAWTDFLVRIIAE
jgi:hypothetical protein